MFITGTPRHQMNLFEEKLDELVSPDNPVRFIDAYVEQLDLKKLGFKIPGTNGGKGKPPYNPSVLLKIYILGYLNCIRSSRKLEMECNKNIEMMWLTERLAPDFKTIADFRKANKKGINEIFREFLNLCKKLELLSFQCVAIDGTKERAKNHLDNVYRRETIENVSQRIQCQIDKYMAELDDNDKTEDAEYEFLSKNLTEKLAKLNKSQNKIDLIKQVFNENPELEVYFANDTDSRYMKDNNRINAGYNCQTAVDEKHKLIVANDVTNDSNDLHQLNNMKDKVSDLKKDFEIKYKTVVVADAGYFEEKEIIKAEEDENFEVYVSHPRDSHKQKTKVKDKKDKVPAKGFLKDDFKYDKEKDVFECPEGGVLTKQGNGSVDKRTGTRKYEYISRNCNGCSKRKLCTKSKYGRSVKVTEFFKEINSFREKCNTDIGKKLLAKRKELVEHPFGTIKHSWGYRCFMQKGKEAVAAEFSFIAFIYNLRRVLNIVEFDVLMKALKAV